MRQAPQILVPRHCPHCGGPLYRDYDGDYSCLMCGECTYLAASGAHGAMPPSTGRDNCLRRATVTQQREHQPDQLRRRPQPVEGRPSRGGKGAPAAATHISLLRDFIPVLGLLDDLILVPLGIAVVLKLTPAVVMADCHAQAQAAVAGGRLSS